MFAALREASLVNCGFMARRGGKKDIVRFFLNLLISSLINLLTNLYRLKLHGAAGIGLGDALDGDCQGEVPEGHM